MSSAERRTSLPAFDKDEVLRTAVGLDKYGLPWEWATKITGFFNRLVKVGKVVWSPKRPHEGLAIEAERRPSASPGDEVMIRIDNRLFELRVPRQRGFFSQ